MHREIIIRHCAAAILLGVASGAFADSAAGPSKVQSIPPFSEVQKVVWQYFQKQGDFQADDLIVREQVEPLLAKLQQMGLPLADGKQILQRLPGKDDFLPQQLGTQDGKKFMRRIAPYPNAYDRLDRLSRLPHGQQTVRDLIKGPDGYKMIEYMTKTSGGVAMGQMLSKAPDGGDFNLPTERIYTVNALLKRLQQSPAAAKNGK